MITSKMDFKVYKLMELLDTLLIIIQLNQLIAGKIHSTLKELLNIYNLKLLDSTKFIKLISIKFGFNHLMKKFYGSMFKMDKEEKKL